MKSAKQFLVFFLVLVTLIACNPTPEIIVVEVTSTPRPTEIPTNTPEPTATPTPIPIADLDLSPLIIQAGDLPAGFTAAQLRDAAPDMYRDLPVAENTIYQQLAYNDALARGVAIFLYPNSEDRETAYTLIADGMIDPSSIAFGEKAAAFSANIGGVKMTEVVFIRCIAVVHISFSNLQDLDAVTAYAKRLDERLAPLICQYP